RRVTWPIRLESPTAQPVKTFLLRSGLHEQYKPPGIYIFQNCPDIFFIFFPCISYLVRLPTRWPPDAPLLIGVHCYPNASGCRTERCTEKPLTKSTSRPQKNQHVLSASALCSGASTRRGVR